MSLANQQYLNQQQRIQKLNQLFLYLILTLIVITNQIQKMIILQFIRNHNNELL